jgi:hypothetical protein
MFLQSTSFAAIVVSFKINKLVVKSGVGAS